MSDLEEFFKEQIAPYEERLQKLEESDKSKDLEITILKKAVEQMKIELKELKDKLEKTKIGASAASKTPAKKVIKK